MRGPRALRIGVRCGLVASDFFDTGDHFIDRFLSWYFLVQDAVHGFSPYVLIVEHGELVVLGELKWNGAVHELVVNRQTCWVRFPERTLLRSFGHWEPAAQRTFHIRRQILLFQHEG